MSESSAARIRLARPDDAASIVRLVRECYGSSYRRASGVDPLAVAEAIDRGTLIYALAFSPTGEHVGQIALERINDHGLYEHSRAVVSLEHRALGLLSKLDALLLEEVAPERGVRYVVGKAVTSHTRTQGHCRSVGFVA
ncbi:MAG TPA: hypothetical protein VFF73_04570, partial [Planctomycetota bacterium]|nr:hypothetical protein [Planctomycetota bacterium]